MRISGEFTHWDQEKGQYIDHPGVKAPGLNYPTDKSFFHGKNRMYIAQETFFSLIYSMASRPGVDFSFKMKANNFMSTLSIDY